MRSVWLAMRDEDPPGGGLAELLAAARTQAETMRARPTLWQRWLAGLRRPPALAFATVMVLLGGAVILGRRGVDAPEPARAPVASSVLAQEPAPREAPPPAGPSPAGPSPAGLMPGGSLDRKTDERAAPVEAVTTSAPADGLFAPQAGSVDGKPLLPESKVKLELAVGRTAPPGASEKPAPAGNVSAGNMPAGNVAAGNMPAGNVAAGNVAAVARAPVVTPSKDTARLAGGNTEPRAPSAHDAPKPEPKPKAVVRGSPFEAARVVVGASGDLAAAADSAHHEPPPAAADMGEATKQRERADSTATTVTADDKQPAVPEVPLGQLYKQCEAAARRGDCAAVRVMVGRITKADRSYRARVAKGSPVAKCLAE
jgi:hypothetical protein